MSSSCGPGYTLKETIEIMRDVIATGNCDRMFLETYYYLKKLSEYREIGTLQECRTAMEYWRYLRERRCGLDAVVEKCMQYEQIGTVEECRKAVKKNKAKKIIIRDWNPTKCPTCDHELSTSLGDGYYKHPTFLERCPECGQAIQWKNLEEMEDE